MHGACPAAAPGGRGRTRATPALWGARAAARRAVRWHRGAAWDLLMMRPRGANAAVHGRLRVSNHTPREKPPRLPSKRSCLLPAPLPSSSHLPFVFPHAWKALITQLALMARRKCPAAIPLRRFARRSSAARAAPGPRMRSMARSCGGVRCFPWPCGRDPHFLSPLSSSPLSLASSYSSSCAPGVAARGSLTSGTGKPRPLTSP